MRFGALLTALLLRSAVAASTEKDPATDKPVLKPCTIRSATTGSFFDLNKINLQPPDLSKKPSTDRNTSWHAKGYDYGADFVLNICGPVIEAFDDDKFKDVEGVPKQDWKNVAAYYEERGKIISLGSNNSELVFRGKKLVLNYTGGSPCPTSRDSRDKRWALPTPLDDIESENITSLESRDSRAVTRRKNTIISLLCERDPTAQTNTIAFVATPDECTYIFEARSSAVCPSVDIPQQSIGPGGVFGVILLIAILVYLIGGIVYQRTVMHQRGWRQLPNYGLWSGMMSFFSDMLTILTSSCARCIPGKRRGYNQLDANANGYAGRTTFAGRGHPRRASPATTEEENQLIDELDEEY